MNQILFKKNNKNLKIFKSLLYLSLLFIMSFTVYYFTIYYVIYRKEQISYNLLDSFNIERLYSQSSNNNYLNSSENNNILPIGIIEIPKIKIKYPILPTTNDELLKISACKFYGPSPNTIGNLCIAAHNYDDNRFFGNLKKLDIGDKIKIYDKNNLFVNYYVYKIYEISRNDISCTSQDTNNKREITLITCNNINKKRLIVKAKE